MSFYQGPTRVVGVDGDIGTVAEGRFSWLDRSFLRQPEPLRRELFKPFVLKCPICEAPTESLQIKCKYCNAPLTWQPVTSLGKDDYNLKELPFGSSVSSSDIMAIGLGPQAVMGNASSIIISEVYRPFRPFRFFVNSAIAQNFLIDDFRIGMNSQFVNSSPIPAPRFAVGEGMMMGCDTAVPGIKISIHVTNITACQQYFSGSLEGRVLK